MSRVGQAIINIPDGVEVKKVDNNENINNPVKEDDMKNIVNLIDRVLSNLGNPDVLDAVANDVHVLMKGRELFNS